MSTPNRRAFLSSIAGLVAGGIACGLPIARASDLPTNTRMTFASSWRTNAAKRIINESGDMWLAVRERSGTKNPILIAFDDEIVIEVRRGDNCWKLNERPLTRSETVERDLCRDVGWRIPEFQPWKIRAWVKNGRRPEWAMSIESYE
ncbi:MAG TPA: hypothetical protein VF290_22210 [Pyrinomonadaceae bacterium]